MVVGPDDKDPEPGYSGDIVLSKQGLPGGDVKLARRSDDPEAPSTAQGVIPLALPAPSSSNYHSSSSYVPLDENNHRYVGLVNQAMTCYLNSLIQSLYMTPEFRNALYIWEYKPKKGSAENSIPSQLQKLFILLQTSDRDALETKELTTSFGWQSNEAYDQHDVQELCRLMFDALEVKWRNSPNEKLIQNLYRGTMQDFVKCLTCSKENLREDFFLDLPLALKPFGSMEAYQSVEQALSAFVAPELLDGCNQYFCETCNQKRDAHKGLRVTKFPRLLTIQLKRFDFDYNTMHRIKLNDKLTFPDVLNLNPFVYRPDHPEQTPGVLIDGRTTVSAGEPLDQELVDELLKQGEYVYELFSVMVHQGSAAGGHYYAYVKNMDQDKWYLFNDTRVELATPSEIQKTFGGSLGGWSGSNTNAYMLMYRKIDPNENVKFTRTPDLPQHITRLLQEWKQQEEAIELERKRRASLVKITVKLNMVCDAEQLLQEPFITELNREEPIAALFSQAYKHFDRVAKRFSTHLAKNSCRLIRLAYNNRMVDHFVSKNQMEKPLSILLSPTSHHSNIMPELHFFLDVRRNHQFSDITTSIKTCAVQRVDIIRQIVKPKFYVALDSDMMKVIQVKAHIGRHLDESPNQSIAARLVLETDACGSDNMVLLDMPSKVLRDELNRCYMDMPLFYYDGGIAGTFEDHNNQKTLEMDRKLPLVESAMYKVLDRKKHAMQLRLVLPSQEQVSRAASVCSAILADMPEQVTQSPRRSVDQTPSVAGTLDERIDEDDRIDEDEVEDTDDSMSLGSMNHPTPQMSPNVSDNDENPVYDNLSKVWPERDVTPQRLYQDSDTCSSSTLVPTSGDCSGKIVVLNVDEDGLMTLDADSRTTILEFKQWIADQLSSINPSLVVLHKHHTIDRNDVGLEANAKDEESMSNFSTCSWLSVSLRPPLNDGEKRIKIIEFDMLENDVSNWKHLFDFPASEQTTINEVAIRCQRLYQELCGTSVNLNQIRLRDFSTPSKSIMSLKNQLHTRTYWYNPIYLEIIKDQNLIDGVGEPILVRRFRPSTVEVGPTHELLVDLEKASSLSAAIKASISQYSGIPVDHVEMTEPTTGPWDSAKWPHLKSRLEMLDGEVRFVKELHPLGTDSPATFLQKIGNKVFYYRDCTEPKKTISADERKQIIIKDKATTGTTTGANRRKERPLRIQLSSVSEA